MNSSVAVNIRIPLPDAKLIKRAAKAKKKKLSAYVREAAIRAAAIDTNADGHFTDRPA